jgi:hypothetical protein
VKNELELDLVEALASPRSRTASTPSTRPRECLVTASFPRRFQDPSTPKNVLFNMTLIALDDVIFKIEVHILNGMWLPAVDFFRC